MKNLAMLPSYFDYIFVNEDSNQISGPNQARNFCQLKARTRPEPDPNSPARLTTLALRAVYRHFAR